MNRPGCYQPERQLLDGIRTRQTEAPFHGARSARSGPPLPAGALARRPVARPPDPPHVPLDLDIDPLADLLAVAAVGPPAVRAAAAARLRLVQLVAHLQAGPVHPGMRLGSRLPPARPLVPRAPLPAARPRRPYTWVADLDDARLYAYNRADGERQPAKDIATDPGPMGLWSDGQTLWVADWRERMCAYRLLDGKRLPQQDIVAVGRGDPAVDELEGPTGPRFQDAGRRGRRGPGPADGDPRGPGQGARGAGHCGRSCRSGIAERAERRGPGPGANRVRHLQPLAGLERLRMLRLDGNRLSELRSLSRLNGLADLRLAGNTVENLGPIAGLEGLRRLDLRGNSVGDLRPLRGLPSLAWVHVGGSRIQDLAPLDGLDGLTVAGRDDLEPPFVGGGRVRRSESRQRDSAEE